MQWQYNNLDDLKEKASKRAIRFLRERYALSEEQVDALRAVPLFWNRGCRSRFYHRSSKHPEGKVMISIVDRPWSTYDRVRVGLTTPAGGIPVPRLLGVTLSLIHEWTHALQAGACGHEKRNASEVETTQNEIGYVKQHAPYLADRLIAYEQRT